MTNVISYQEDGLERHSPDYVRLIWYFEEDSFWCHVLFDTRQTTDGFYSNLLNE